MDKIRIESFLGLYTNADEADLNPQYQVESLNLRQRAGYIESEGYSVKRVLTPIENIVFSEEVEIDNDRFGSKLENSEAVINYQQSFKKHILTQDSRFAIYLSDVPVGRVSSKISKIVNTEGIVKILLESGDLYYLEPIDRYNLQKDEQITIPHLLSKLEVSSLPLSFYSDSVNFGYNARIRLQYSRSVPVIGTTNPAEYDIHYQKIDTSTGENYGEVLFYSSDPPATISNNNPDMVFVNTGYHTIIIPLYTTWAELTIPGLPLGWVMRETLETTVFEVPVTVTSTDYGFDKNNYEIIQTAVYNGTDEFVVSHKKGNYSGTGKHLVIISTPLVTDNRITDLGYYIRFNERDDFELIQFVPVTLGAVGFPSIVLVKSTSPQGIYLSQTIGTVYDKKTYKPITEFQDYIELSGVSYAIYQSRVYHSSIGKGNIMKGVFYDYIPEAQGRFLVDVNGALGVFDRDLVLIVPQDSGEGYLLFSEKDKMSFEVRDRFDYTVSPEGVLIHTSRGIYATNGYERKLISEAINDIVERNYENGDIFYSQNDEILFYSCSEGVFRYDFVYGQWTQLSITTGGKFFFSKDRKIYVYEDGYLYQLVKTNDVVSKIRTPEVDLEYPSILKNIVYVVVDFEGELSYGYVIKHTKRKTVQLGVPVGSRVPKNTVGTELYFKGKIYSIEIYYDIVGEMRNADFIPSPEIIAEGIPELQSLLAYQKSIAEAST